MIRTLNYALNTLGYKRAIMIGKSGGGWTTTLIAALDPRVALSFPIAGSIPLNFHHISWDFEQMPRNASETWYLNVGQYSMLYALATVDAEGGRTRSSVQVLHENDPCCYYGHDRHEGILQYDAEVMAALPDGDGVFSTAVTDWNVHAICQMDRLVMATAKGQWAAGKVIVTDALPCDILRAKSLPCPFAPPNASRVAAAHGEWV